MINMEVVGVTGPLASGKGVVTDYLVSKGYMYLSLSRIVREEARKKGVPEKRENLISMGNELRRIYGYDVLAKKAIEKIKSLGEGKYVVDGIRNPYEVEAFRNAFPNFYLLGMDAPQEIRLQRALERARESDPKTLEGFKSIDEKDMSIGIELCLDMADHVEFNPWPLPSKETSKPKERILYEIDTVLGLKIPSRAYFDLLSFRDRMLEINHGPGLGKMCFGTYERIRRKFNSDPDSITKTDMEELISILIKNKEERAADALRLAYENDASSIGMIFY